MSRQALPPPVDPPGRPPAARLSGFFGRILAGVALVGVLVAGVMLSALLIASAVVIGVAFVGYLWWAKRKVMRRLREDPAFADLMQQRQPRRDVIEGEVIHSEWQDRTRR